MSLSIVGNSALLFARQNLGATHSSLNSSLQQLPTGLRIDPTTEASALSPQLDSITSANTAVDAVQTADGALGEINRLLTTIKAFAINSANAGADDSTTRELDQRQISNALAAINSLTQTTLAGNINLFAGGSAAASSAPAGTFFLDTAGGTFSPLDFAIAIRAYTKQSVAAIGQLSNIDVSSTDDAKAAIAVVESAITDVARSRGRVYGLETQTLQALQSGLQASSPLPAQRDSGQGRVGVPGLRDRA
jgi:flagellin